MLYRTDFLYEIETKYFYKNVVKEVEKRSDTSGSSKDDEKPLPIEQNDNFIGLMKDELSWKIVMEFVALRSKMYAYKKLDRKLKFVTKKCLVAERLTFDDYKIWLRDDKKYLAFIFLYSKNEMWAYYAFYSLKNIWVKTA